MPSYSNYIHDLPAIEDSLGRVHFADALARSLVLPNGSPGLVVGIEGSWGSGKSTLIGFIRKYLSKSSEVNPLIVVEFNPWMVSNTGALVEALIGQIAVSIGKNLPEGQKGIKVSQKLISYVGLLKNLKYVPGLSWAGQVAEDIPSIWQAIASAAEEGAEAGEAALGNFEKLLPSLDISQKRAEVVAALKELDRPIVIVVDDLDRLPAEEIRAMIQAIKAVADFPRITYLLAYDRSIIARALAADEISGLSYLEKIVQVAYPIPPLSQRQIKQFANDKVKSLLDALNMTLRDYEDERYEKAMSLLTKLARHPRDVVRIINRLALSLPATHGEVNAADVIVFEALSQRFPDLREAIRNHSADFINHFFQEDMIDDDKGAEDWSEYFADKDADKKERTWLKYLPKDEYDQKISKKACLFLFTYQEKNGSPINPAKYLGIADPDRLARLFRMTSIEEVPEVKGIHELLQDSVKLKVALQVDEDEQLHYLLEWLINYAPSCQAPDINGCIEKLIDLSKELSAQRKLTNELADKLADLMELLLRSKLIGYENCFLSIVENAPLSISVNIVLIAAAEIGKWGWSPERKVSDVLQLISNAEIVDKAIQAWLKRVRESVDHGHLYKEVNLFRILYRFAQFNKDGYQGAYDAISMICATNEGLAAFLSYFERESHSLDDRISLVEDAEIFALRIENSKFEEKYSWLIKLLREDATIELVKEKTAKQKLKQELKIVSQ